MCFSVLNSPCLVSSISFGLRFPSSGLSGSLLLKQLCKDYFKVFAIPIIRDISTLAPLDCLPVRVWVFIFLMLDNSGLHPERLKYHIRRIFRSPVNSVENVDALVSAGRRHHCVQTGSSNQPPVG